MDLLREYLLDCGAGLVGYADLNALPDGVHDGLPHAVSIAVAVPAESVAAMVRKGHRFAHPDSALYSALMTFGGMAARFLEDRGHRAEVEHVTRQADVSHKAVATLAGLGWVGKCNLLVTPEYGSAVRLVSVLTDADLPTGEPVAESRCGDCDECVEECPVDAPNGQHWSPEGSRDDYFDWRACRDYKQELQSRSPALSCGVCMGVCPWTRAYVAGTGRAPAG